MRHRLLVVPAVLLAALWLGGCRHKPTPRDLQGSDIHHDLGIEAQLQGNRQLAYAEFQRSLELNPNNARAHNAMGVLLHLGHDRPEQAIGHFERALALDPQLSEARVNLGNVFLAQGRFEEAAKLYREALNDMRYATPYIAQGNLGWAQYKLGNLDEAVDHIRAAITLEPKFCLGYRNLAEIYEAQQRTAEACRQLERYRESCPEAPEAYYRLGMCLTRLGRQQDAVARFAECEALAPEGELKEDCRERRRQLE
jgi:type IV pilus assembly protein PilF